MGERQRQRDKQTDRQRVHMLNMHTYPNRERVVSGLGRKVGERMSG